MTGFELIAVAIAVFALGIGLVTITYRPQMLARVIQACRIGEYVVIVITSIAVVVNALGLIPQHQTNWRQVIDLGILTLVLHLTPHSYTYLAKEDSSDPGPPPIRPL